MTRFKSLLFALILAPGAGLACDLPTNAAQMMADAGAAVNAQRAAKGLRALSRDGKLDQAAQSHACWMGDSGTFSHKGKGGSLPRKRVKSAGYRAGLTAENIAFGQPSGGAVVSEWMTSQGHRKNILLPGVKNYGIGVAQMNGRPVWVMVYAAK